MAADNQVMLTVRLHHDQAMGHLHADDFAPIAAQANTDHA